MREIVFVQDVDQLGAALEQLLDLGRRKNLRGHGP